MHGNEDNRGAPPESDDGSLRNLTSSPLVENPIERERATREACKERTPFNYQNEPQVGGHFGIGMGVFLV